jgi:hypothetical protein
MRTLWIPLSLLASLFAMIACSKTESAPDPSASGSAAAVTQAPAPPPPRTTTTPAQPDAPIVANWMKGAPDKAPKAKAGDTVWAIVPSTSQSNVDIGLLGLFKVDAVKGTTVSLSGPKLKYELPGVFVIPLADETKLKVGDAVIAPFMDGWGPGRIAKNDKGALTVHYYLSDGTAKDAVAAHASPIAPGSTTAPFALAYYEKFPGKNYVGFVVGQDGGKTWMLDHDSGFVTVTTAKLKVLPWAFKDRKIGDNVVVFGGMGQSDGTIEKVLDARGYFQVKDQYGSFPRSFDHLADKL